MLLCKLSSFTSPPDLHLGGNIISWLKGVMKNYKMLISGMIKMAKGTKWKIFREEANLIVQEETLLEITFQSKAVNKVNGGTFG